MEERSETLDEISATSCNLEQIDEKMMQKYYDGMKTVNNLNIDSMTNLIAEIRLIKSLSNSATVIENLSKFDDMLSTKIIEISDKAMHKSLKKSYS